MQEIRPRLDGTGEPEAQLTGPIEQVFKSAVASLGLDLVIYGQSNLPDFGVKPDFALKVAGGLAGYVEIKRPGKGADPTLWSPRSHDGKQWRKLKLLPNVLYTDGFTWGLYRNGARVGDIGTIVRPSMRKNILAASFEYPEVGRVVHDFLLWQPAAPRTLDQLVRSISGLCRLLRDEVAEALRREKAGERTRLFSLLADDWRNLLFPDASDLAFTDGYAQTVTFALLLARVEGVDFNARSIAEIARLLGRKRALMGKALGVLTDDFVGNFDVAVDTLVRVIGAVDWNRFNDTAGEAYYRLYEPFLSLYDPTLRRQTGSYYTPPEVVSFMVKFVDQVVRSKLGRSRGFASPDVVVVDPAMGTGTYLTEIIRNVASTVREEEGPGAVPAQLTSLARRLIGLEKQIGPFAVAEWRVNAAFKEEANVTPEHLRLYAADTLANPYIEETRLPSGYEAITRSLRAANRMKREEPVMVVIGNPPYRDKAGGLGGWVERGDPSAIQPSLLDGFRLAGNGRYESVLSNLGTYFWRWATWKVFNAHPDACAGVVAFITTSRYTSGPGFAGMREYLRRNANEGWIIDLSPEGHRPAINTRVFPGVQQPLCIGIFVRYGETRDQEPATIRYSVVEGSVANKFAKLATLNLESDSWRLCARGWTDPFLPGASAEWSAYVSLGDLMPWSSRGVTTGHTWIHGPHPETLGRRWAMLVASDDEQRRLLFGESPQLTIDSVANPLPGIEPRSGPISLEVGSHLPLVRYGFRSFDRQWIIPDSRLMARARTSLWAVRSAHQIYLTELHSESPSGGPPVTFTANVPDIHHYKGSGAGRVLPLYRDASGNKPNVMTGLLGRLSRQYGEPVEAPDLVAYIAALVSHGGFTRRFSRELDSSGGVRVPLTADPDLWRMALSLGRKVLWLQTLGERFNGASTDSNSFALHGPDRPKVWHEIPHDEEFMPDVIEYVPESRTLRVGSGEIRPVRPEVWDYKISDTQVIKKWFGYRKKNPAGKKTTPLDHVQARSWESETTTELLELISILSRIVDLEGEQMSLLDAVCTGLLIEVAELTSEGLLPIAAEQRRRPSVPKMWPGQASLL